MIIRIKRRVLESVLVSSLLLLAAISAFIGVSLTTNYVVGGVINVTNNTVLAKVNITNTEPNITSVTVDDGTSIPANQIDLTANSVTIVTCNATVFDFNGWQDINPNKTNATFFMSSYGGNSQPDNNTLYFNGSCGSCRQASEAALSTYTAYCDCKFGVQYYANASSNWLCNFSVMDKGGTQLITGSELNLTDYEVSATTTVTSLLAINSSLNVIDYGNLSVTQTSSEIIFNVTNGGNTNINLTLRGYGGTNDSTDSIAHNLSMICDFGNMSIGSQRYALGSENQGTTSFNAMRTLQNQTEKTNFTLFQRTNDSSYGSSLNTTIWRLQVPLSVGGLCNGTIIFGAVSQY